jgi:hypothetical protein
MTIDDAIKAAEEAGLSPKIAPKLSGETLEELRADARWFREQIGPPAPAAEPVELPDLHAGAREPGQPSQPAGTGWFKRLGGGRDGGLGA